jgi:tRNA modification GTPase
MDDSTIAAIASPAGRGGISIIKISGPSAVTIASAIFRPASTEPADVGVAPAFDSHRLCYGHIADAETGRILDEVLLSVMRAPRTYTREDVVEINSHGSPIALRAILELILRQGARLAEPGEFTRRAFLNGRIDLTQAEAVIDLINARTHRVLEISAAQLGGALRKDIEAYRCLCFDLLARIEAGIDFPEEVDDIIDGQAMGCEFRRKVVAPMQQLIRNYVAGRVIREGAAVAIVGRPNVGKSSLMNQLLSRERAIVTPYPGTTRDVIEDTLNLQGLAISLWDTAGLHDASGDPVEAIGMLKTEEHLKSADVVLFVLEAHQALCPDDWCIFEKIRSRSLVFVLNKIDLLNGARVMIELPDYWPKSPCVAVSALSGQGLERLREVIAQAIREGSTAEADSAMIPNLRQKAILERCVEAAEASATSLENGIPSELVSIHLNETVNALDEILGTRVKPDILETIFGRFCIGK